MRKMSFYLTQRQIRSGSKTVTRRLGWANLKPGEHVMAIVKGQGIPKGGHVEHIRELVCVSNRPEHLSQMLIQPDYGREEVVKEGFPELTPEQFVAMFCKHMGCEPQKLVNRIEIDYV